MDLCYRGWCLQHASIAIFVLGGNVAQNMKLEAFWKSETFLLWRNLNQPCGFKLCAAHSSGDPLHDYGHKTRAMFGNRIRSYRDTETLVSTFYHNIEIRHSIIYWVLNGSLGLSPRFPSACDEDSCRAHISIAVSLRSPHVQRQPLKRKEILMHAPWPPIGTYGFTRRVPVHTSPYWTIRSPILPVGHANDLDCEIRPMC